MLRLGGCQYATTPALKKEVKNFLTSSHEDRRNEELLTNQRILD